MLGVKKLGLCAAVGIGLASLMTVSAASAKELPAGTVIKASNLDQLKSDTFEHKTIQSMLTQRLEWLIRKHGLEITLAHSKPIPISETWKERTQENAGKASINPKTHELENWTGSGSPFPYSDISTKDPQAAWKLMWDYYVGHAPAEGDYTHFPKFAYLLISGNNGLQRTQVWSWYRVYMAGLISKGHKPVQGDGKILTKTMIRAVYPRDISGLGTLTIRYTGNKPDNTWAYLPAVRRVRRVSGAAWMDPIGGTDQLQEDINIWNIRPNSYPTIRILKKRWLLVTAHETYAWNSKGGNNAQKYPLVDLQHKPYWNPKAPNVKWEPRQVYVVEGISPKIDPYSKKIMYVDTKLPWIWQGETFDKSGRFWKYMYWLEMDHTCMDGTKVMWPTVGMVLDYKRMHGTIFLSNHTWRCNPPGLTPDKVSLGKLMSSSP